MTERPPLILLAPAGLYVARLGLGADTEGAGLEKEHILKSIALAY